MIIFPNMESSIQALYDSAMVLYEELEYEEAIAPLKQAADNGHLLAAEKLANCYNRTGSSELAVPYWEICRKVNNHSANTNYAGYLREFTDQLDLAIELWRNAADAGIPQAAFNLGVWLKNNGEVEEGKKYLKKSGDLGYLDGYFVLAGIFYRAKEWSEAKEALEPLLVVEDSRAANMLAEIELREDPIQDSADIPIADTSKQKGIDWI